MLRRISYRLKQFYFGMFSKYTKTDAVFARSFLSSEELALFNQLPGFEKKHSVIVAKKMRELALYNPELDQRKLVRLGLLHDIGKVIEHNSVVTKSILVIIRFLFPGLFNRLADSGREHPLYRRFFIHKHHGEAGAAILAKLGVSAEIVAMVRKHDPLVEPFGPADPIELKILQDADSSY